MFTRLFVPHAKKSSAATRSWPPLPARPQGSTSALALARSLTSKATGLELATDGGQICGPPPGGWGPDARWGGSRAAGHRMACTDFAGTGPATAPPSVDQDV